MLHGERDIAEAIVRDWAARERRAPAAPAVQSLTDFVEQLGSGCDDDDDQLSVRPSTQRQEHRASEEALARPAPGNPIPLVLAEGEELAVLNQRQFECPVYDGCLDFAAVRNWPSFSCNACSGPGCKP